MNNKELILKRLLEDTHITIEEMMITIPGILN